MPPEALALADMLRSPDLVNHQIAAQIATDDQFAKAFKILFKDVQATDEWRTYVGVTVFRSECVNLVTATDWHIVTAASSIARDIAKYGRWHVGYRLNGGTYQLEDFKSLRGAALRIKKILQE